MAVRFNASGERLLKTTGVLDYNGLYSVSFWTFVAAGSAAQTIFALSDGTNDNTDRMGYTAAEASVCNVTIAAASTTVGTVTFTGNTWYHIGLVRSSVTSLTIYINGVSDGNNTVDVTSRAAVSRMEFGGRQVSSANFSGMAAYIKMWSGVSLSNAEILNERQTIRPCRYDGLYGFWPVFPGTAERLRDYSGNGRDWTEVGTLSDEDSYPIPWGAQSYYIPPVIPVAVPVGGVFQPVKHRQQGTPSMPGYSDRPRSYNPF